MGAQVEEVGTDGGGAAAVTTTASNAEAAAAGCRGLGGVGGEAPGCRCQVETAGPPDTQFPS